jgi:hypothetical protein
MDLERSELRMDNLGAMGGRLGEFAKLMAAGLISLILACGGSGSTGLILPEGIALDTVRQGRTCVESGGTLYCATNSVDTGAHGGLMADRPAIPVPSPTPSPHDSGVPTPSPSGTPNRDGLVLIVSGAAPGTACATAARLERGMGDWSLGVLVAVPLPAAPVAYPLPAGLTLASAEVVLLCFRESPASTPFSIENLSDALPDVVFVP